MGDFHSFGKAKKGLKNGENREKTWLLNLGFRERFWTPSWGKKSIFMRVRTGHFCFCLINDRLRERKKYKGPVKGKLEMGIKHWNLLL